MKLFGVVCAIILLFSSSVLAAISIGVRSMSIARTPSVSVRPGLSTGAVKVGASMGSVKTGVSSIKSSITAVSRPKTMPTATRYFNGRPITHETSSFVPAWLLVGGITYMMLHDDGTPLTGNGTVMPKGQTCTDCHQNK